MFQTPGSTKFALLILLFLGPSWPACGQAPQAPGSTAVPAAAAPAPAGFAVANLRPALANVQTAIGNLNIGHWKASSAIRATVQQDVASMQRDLSTTLPALMSQVDAAAASGPAALSPSFAVFRNVDALYDVLLRVTETAALVGPSSDASDLEDARAGLEDGRGKLGAWLLQSIGAQDAQIARLQAPAPPPASAPPPAPTKIVVNDGPNNTKPRKKKPATPPAPQ
jgi:hypothetical protein